MYIVVEVVGVDVVVPGPPVAGTTVRQAQSQFGGCQSLIRNEEESGNKVLLCYRVERALWKVANYSCIYEPSYVLAYQ